MLTVLVPLLAALASPLPVLPAPSAPSPLKEIGRVQSLSTCSAIVVHANAAIARALDNDEQLTLAINRLRTTDLDTTNEIARRNGMNDLSTLAGRIRSAASAGFSEIKRLRVIGAGTTDFQRNAELKAFSDALSGALVRQRKAGTDLDKMLVIIDGRRAVAEVHPQEQVDQRASMAGMPVARRGPLALDDGTLRSPVSGTTLVPVNDTLRGFADEFATRTQAILSDEGVAADHALGAATGC